MSDSLNPSSLIDLLKEIANSDMAMREEDEGNTSPLLDKVRKAILSADGERENARPDEGFNSPPPLQSTPEPPIELLPCPFCGARGAPICSSGNWKVICSCCGSSTGIRPWSAGDSEECAREAWNSRVNRTPDLEVVEDHTASEWMPPTGATIGRWKQHQVITRRDWIGVLTMLEELMAAKASEISETSSEVGGAGDVPPRKDVECVAGLPASPSASETSPAPAPLPDEVSATGHAINQQLIDIEAAIREMEALSVVENPKGKYHLEAYKRGRNDAVQEAIAILHRIAGEKEGV